MPGIDDRSGRTPALTVVQVDVSGVGTFAGSVESELPANVRSRASGPVKAAHAMAARYLVTDVLPVRSADAAPAITWAPTGEAP